MERCNLLLDVPPELTERIALQCGGTDALSLRLVSREIDARVVRVVATVYFKRLDIVPIMPASVARASQVAKHTTFSRYVREIALWTGSFLHETTDFPLYDWQANMNKNFVAAVEVEKLVRDGTTSVGQDLLSTLELCTSVQQLSFENFPHGIKFWKLQKLVSTFGKDLDDEEHEFFRDENGHVSSILGTGGSAE